MNRLDLINKVHIILGQKCNLHCVYCIQKDNETEEPEMDASLLDFVIGIYNRNNFKNNFRVHFYGGEPLIYYDRLVDIVTQLKAKGYKGTFSITTNGLLLDEEKTKFFNDNKFKFTISWDGRYALEDRGFDSVKEREDLLMKIGWLQVNMTVRAPHFLTDALEDFVTFDDKYTAVTGHHAILNVYLAQGKNESVDGEFVYDADACRDNIFNALIDTTTDKFTRRYLAKTPCSEADNRDFLKRFENNGPAYCDRFNSFAVRLNGNLMYCANSDIKVGHISDIDAAITEKDKDCFAPEKCKTCSAVALCKFGCPLISEDNIESYCDMRKAIVEGCRKFNIEAIKL